jgi:hypothetical protein
MEKMQAITALAQDTRLDIVRLLVQPGREGVPARRPVAD